MKIVKVLLNGESIYAELKDGCVFPIVGDLFGEFSVEPTGLPLEDAILLAPINPSKIICVGKNYVDHIGEMTEQFSDGRAKAEFPEQPELFFKPNSAINNPNGEIEYPEGALRVDYEGEIGVVIKKQGRYIQKEGAMDYILGLTLVNDVSRRDRPASESQWSGGKCYDTFCPVGPWITAVDSLEGIEIKTYLNGELKQSSDIEHMIFGIAEVIEFASSRMTLMPGDIIATGTPSGVSPMKVGDIVTISSPTLGELTNRVVAQKRQ